MQVDVGSAVDIIASALDGIEVGSPNSSLTPAQIEQIASICAGKAITIDPADLAQAVADYANAQQAAAQAALPAGSMPVASTNGATAAIAAVVAAEPPAPPPVKGPEWAPRSAGEKGTFSDDLDRMLREAGASLD